MGIKWPLISFPPINLWSTWTSLPTEKLMQEPTRTELQRFTQEFNWFLYRLKGIRIHWLYQWKCSAKVRDQIDKVNQELTTLFNLLQEERPNIIEINNLRRKK